MAAKITIQDIKFIQTAFDQLLQQQGIKMTREKAIICPNRKSIDQESHNINCDMCNAGYIYFGEEEFTGLLQTSGLEKVFKDAGTWSTGTAILTAPSAIRFDYFDKISVPGARGRFNQLLKRSATGNIDKPHFEIKGIHYVIGANNTVYGLNSDFEITKDGQIEWLGANKPANNTIYSISYEYTPSFIVLDHLNFIRDMDEVVHKNLPQRIVMRLDYLTEFNQLTAPAE